MNRLMYTLIVVLLILSVTLTGVAGPGNRTGTGGAAQLLVPVGARDIAMGGGTIATTRGVEALFWNPAGVAHADRSVNVLFSHMSYFADIGVEYGAVSTQFGDVGTIALNVKSLSVGEIPVTTTENPDGTGQMYSPQHITAGLTYARLLSDRIAVGLTGTFISEKIADVSASGFAFNIGVIYDNLASLNGLSLGVAVKNIGPQMQYDGPALYQIASVDGQNRPPQYMQIEAAPFELPTSIEIGMGYKTAMGENASVQFAGGFQSNNFSEDEYKIGAEAMFNKMFFVRAGYSFAPNTPDDSEYLYGFTAGAGVELNLGDAALGVDYAYRDTEFFSGNHIIGLRLGF